MLLNLTLAVRTPVDGVRPRGVYCNRQLPHQEESSRSSSWECYLNPRLAVVHPRKSEKRPPPCAIPATEHCLGQHRLHLALPMQAGCKRWRLRGKRSHRYGPPSLPTVQEDLQSNFDFVEKVAGWEQDVIDQDRRRRKRFSSRRSSLRSNGDLRRQLRDLEQRRQAEEKRARAAEKRAMLLVQAIGLLGVSFVIVIAADRMGARLPARCSMIRG